jgi:hypothetical protein
LGQYGWTENIAEAILYGLADALKKGTKTSQVLKEAYDNAVSGATGFPCDHPIFCTVIALGILVILMPCVLEALGFAELWPVEGEIRSFWSTIDANYTPAGTFARYMAIEICRLCAREILVLIISAARHSLASISDRLCHEKDYLP